MIPDKVIILLGPTCVGKTGLSILLAQSLNTEIISADSMQVYRHMDIGTAKPSPAQLKAVKHHLINVISPSESFSAGSFRERAIPLIKRLHRLQKIPLVTGGTGLYIRTLTQGLFDGPPADWNLRNRLVEEEKLHGSGLLYERLREIDPLTAASIKPNDTRRTVRALEVALTSGTTMTDSRKASTRPLACDFIKVGLTRKRKELYGMIENRVDAMVKKGLLRETADLLKMSPSRTPLQALGYKEMQLYLNHTTTLDEAIRLSKKRTKLFAKRQITWFNKEPGIHWIDVTGITDPDDMFSKVVEDIEFLKELIYGKKDPGAAKSHDQQK